MQFSINGYEFNPSTFTFPGGEVNVNILAGFTSMPTIDNITIRAVLRNSDDIMALLLAKDAFDRYLLARTHKPLFILDLPYLPYARQDRVCNKGEAFSIKVMADLINSMNFDKVFLTDVHSEVGKSLINNSIEFAQYELIAQSQELSNRLRSGATVLVSPDSGAEKKTHKVAQYFGCDTIRATKRRNVKTGKIESISIIDPIPENKSFLIVDDICDGGGTFIPLAGELGDVDLYVTHGIFSKGTQILLDNFGTLYTTDSYYQDESSENIKVIKNGKINSFISQRRV